MKCCRSSGAQVFRSRRWSDGRQGRPCSSPGWAEQSKCGRSVSVGAGAAGVVRRRPVVAAGAWPVAVAWCPAVRRGSVSRQLAVRRVVCVWSARKLKCSAAPARRRVCRTVQCRVVEAVVRLSGRGAVWPVWPGVPPFRGQFGCSLRSGCAWKCMFPGVVSCAAGLWREVLSGRRRVGRGGQLRQLVAP